MAVSYGSWVGRSVWVMITSEVRRVTESADEFEGWYHSTEPRLRAALVARYGSEAGRDAAAAALVWAWENWDRVRLMDNGVGYLYRVGRSKARRRREGWLGAPVTDGETRYEPGLPSALAALPAKQRTAVVLVHGYGWSFAEAAEVLGVTKSTVQSHVERGMAALRQRLGVSL